MAAIRRARSPDSPSPGIPELPVIRLSIVLLAALGAGCAARGTGAADAAPMAVPAARDSLSGTLRLVGSAPVNVRLVVQGPAGSTTLTGPLREELQRLAGAEVVLQGRREGSAFMPTDYRISAVDGRPVTMGTIDAITGEYARLRTVDGGVVYLAGSGGQFRVGQKVWVQGPAAVVVQTHGIIRP